MPTAATTKPSARELRREAKNLDIEGWQDMDVKGLQAAIKAAKRNGATERPARKATATKATAPAKKATKSTAAKARPRAAANGSGEVAENGNPYKEGTNLWHVTEELLIGGKRSAMVKRLKRKIELKPRTDKADFDLDYELDRRVLIVAQLLERDHGFTKTKEGRGTGATIQVFPPR